MTSRRTRRSSRRKDKVLNTRITEELEQELRRQAEEMDMPVSQLVRRILQRTVDMVGNISGNVEHLVTEAIEDVVNLADAARYTDKPQRFTDRRELENVVGWQPIVVTEPSTCALTDEPLEPGDQGYLSVKVDGTEPLVISETTFAALTKPVPDEEWVKMVASRALVCPRTGDNIEPGDTAWVLVGSSPPTIISDEAHSAIER